LCEEFVNEKGGYFNSEGFEHLDLVFELRSDRFFDNFGRELDGLSYELVLHVN
jgi:hypothetical protein